MVGGTICGEGVVVRVGFVFGVSDGKAVAVGLAPAVGVREGRRVSGVTA
jgi:hypothetical protein